MDNLRLIMDLVDYNGKRGRVAVNDGGPVPLAAVFAVECWTARGTIRQGIEPLAVVPVGVAVPQRGPALA